MHSGPTTHGLKPNFCLCPAHMRAKTSPISISPPLPPRKPPDHKPNLRTRQIIRPKCHRQQLSQRPHHTLAILIVHVDWQIQGTELSDYLSGILRICQHVRYFTGLSCHWHSRTRHRDHHHHHQDDINNVWGGGTSSVVR